MPIAYANYGWSPKAGVWYPKTVTPMPRVCHRSLRLSILKQIYTNIKSESENTNIDPDTENLSADSSGEDLSGE